MSDAHSKVLGKYSACLIVGRGESAEGFWTRYDGSFYVLGINPGAVPRQSKMPADPCDGRFRGCLGRFDGIVTADDHYAEWLLRQDYDGDVYIEEGLGFSFALACLVARRLGFRRVVLAGIDCLTVNYTKMRPTILGHVDLMKARGVQVFRDPQCLFKDLGPPYDPFVE